MKSRFALILLSFLFTISVQAEEELKCSQSLTSSSPLLISDATDMGKRDYENFRETMIPKGDNVSHFITKRSIVKLLRPLGRGESYMNVEVLGEAKVNEARAKGYNAQNATNKALPQAMRGQKGFIHKDSLQASDNYVFVVSKDSQFIALPSPYDTASAFRIAKSGSKYKVNRCCVDSNKSDTCIEYPIFEALLSGSWKETEDDLLNSQIYCRVTTSTRPVEKDQYQAVLSILKHPHLGLSAGFLPGDRTQGQADDLYFVDGRGLVMLPHVLANRGTAMTEGPYGSYHFTGGGEDIQGDDAYLAPYAACGFMAVMREWNRRYPDCAGKGCGIAWGNCSHSTHVASVRGKWPSRTHGHGHCIDIRLFTKTNSSVSTAVGSSIYNRNRVVEFLQLSRAAGATTIYLEDSSAARQVHKQSGRGYPPVLTRVPPHKDHMHVCFSHRSTDSRSSFADPLAPATNSRLKNLCETDSNDAQMGKASDLLSTDVVATAGIKTPDFTVPIPEPRPTDFAEIVARAKAAQAAQEEREEERIPEGKEEPATPEVAEVETNIEATRPKINPRREESEPIIKSLEEEVVIGPQAPVEETAEIPSEATTEAQEETPAEVITEVPVDTNEEAVAEKEPVQDAPDTSVVTEVEQTPEPALELTEEEQLSLPEEGPFITERPSQEVPKITEIIPEAEDDPFKDDGEEEVTTIIQEELRQAELSAQEMEKYYGEEEEKSEIDPSVSEKVIEGDYIENAPIELKVEATQPESTTTDSGPSYVSNYVEEERRPEPRPFREQGVRKPAGKEPASDVEQAIDGAYEPVTSNDKSSGGGFLWSFFNGIWSFLAGLFSFLG